MNRTPSERLVIFTKYPRPGFAKTRLAATLGSENAARLHQQLTERVIRMTRPINTLRAVERVIYYTGGTEEQMLQWLGGEAPLVEQGGSDLGARMLSALRDSRHQNIVRTIIIGTDCPFIDHHLVARAFSDLEHHHIVLGPAIDGGYYLIGLQGDLSPASLSDLFENISWGSNVVYRQTLDRAKALNLCHTSLPPLNDIDHPDDLQHFDYHPGP
ncbi:MAG: TIGR04282 family arsenosugar biosynthesis glycosyltransferase [Desulfobulbaceae bacterium]|nr:TIGR04282 family arsenosugar biosynthesis glycosyltransferase [Desulfobulbaceae bacterium]